MRPRHGHAGRQRRRPRGHARAGRTPRRVDVRQGRGHRRPAAGRRSATRCCSSTTCCSPTASTSASSRSVSPRPRSRSRRDGGQRSAHVPPWLRRAGRRRSRHDHGRRRRPEPAALRRLPGGRGPPPARRAPRGGPRPRPDDHRALRARQRQPLVLRRLEGGGVDRPASESPATRSRAPPSRPSSRSPAATSNACCWRCCPPRLRLLLLEHPTRGLDIESAAWVWSQLLERRTDGTAIVFASSDLDELLRYSDRIAVFFGGRILDVVDASTTDSEALGHMIGGRRR